jgi:dienelactone hydrolase
MMGLGRRHRLWRAVVALMAGLALAQALAAPGAVTATLTLAPLLARNAALPPAPRIPSDAFERRSRLHAVRLSPDGTLVAYLDGDGAKASLHVLDTRTQVARRLLALPGQAALFWSGDSGTLFLAMPDGISAVSLADGSSYKLAAFDGRAEHRLFPADAGHARHVLMATYTAASGAYRLERMDTQGQRELLYQGEQLSGFLLDAHGRLSFSMTVASDGMRSIKRRQAVGWQEVLRCQRVDECTLVAAVPDASRLSMLMAQHGDRSVLVEIDLAQDKRRVLHADRAALADIRRVISDAGQRTPLFAMFESPMLHHAGLTPLARRAVADIDRQFGHGGVFIEAARGGATLLLSESGSRLSQDRYWLYDSARRSTREILHAQRAAGLPLPPGQLAQTSAIHYRASDGVLVHGYLTLPPGKVASSMPLLTLAHGGPWERVNAAYVPLVQLLANRGVAVFQPNFRASVGYGLHYMTAAGGDLGNGRVQADIIDGVRWLLRQGVGDRQRLAIAGHSFGGYATLLALTYTPELFQFGMAIAPSPDFARTLRTIATGPGGDQALPLRLQDLGVDLQDGAVMRTLEAAAPVRHTDQVGKPLLIMAGARDSMVQIASVTDYVARLQLSGKPVSLLVDPEEGHNPRLLLYRQATMYLLEKLLQQHLGGPAPAAPGAQLDTYLRQTLKANRALPDLFAVPGTARPLNAP